MADTIKDFLKEKNYTRKFRPITGREYVLVFGGAEAIMVAGDNGKEEPAVKMLVREKNGTEVFSLVTRSMSLLDQLADIERGDIFSFKKLSKSFGGRVIMVYDTTLVERSNSKGATP